MLAPKIFDKVKPYMVKWENNIFKQTLPMSSWSYKVKTAVYSGVNDVSSIEAWLIFEVALKLLIYIIQNWFKTTNKNNVDI